MFFAFRVEDRNFSTFTNVQKKQIKEFQKFVMKNPDGFCCVCMKIIYPEEQKYRDIPNPLELPCLDWNLTPITKVSQEETKYMVCSSHQKTPQVEFVKFEYPGDRLPELENLNYRERTVLSPIRLMSQITRKSTLHNGVIGHYEMRGALFTTPSYEFAEMAYGGTLGLFCQRGDPAKINKNKIVKAYSALQRTHPLIARYQLPKLTYELVNYHIVQNKKHVGVAQGWTNNFLFANEDTNPQATDVEFNDLLIGRDLRGNMVKYSHPSLFAMVFPYLFTNCKGHYSMMTVDDNTRRNSSLMLPEERGGVASATIRGESMVDYAKSRLMLKDRRFAKDPSFLFFMLDVIEKKNISSANRFVVSTKKRLTGNNRLKQKDVFDNTTGKMRKNIVSAVPSQIRSSYTYKRTNFLDLQCIFNNLGAPQLFMTFTCNDKSEDFNNLMGRSQHPWEDPVLFTAHWKRKWQKFFLTYILKHFAGQIGGIKDFSWVMEIQDCGSPHIHLVLWTEKTVQELIGMEVVHTWFPTTERHQDPIMHKLVENLQIHRCNDNYCKRGDPNRKCRFGFPKPISPVTYMDANQSCTYRRLGNDTWLNNYNPYLLATFQTSMDIQYNNGPQAVRYLAKYLAKDDYEAKIMVKNVHANGQGFYQRPGSVDENTHYKTRIVGAVEAVYDIMGWHNKHKNSRNVLFLNTGLINFDSRRIRNDIDALPENSENIFSKTHVEVYEARTDARNITMPQFFSFYVKATGSKEFIERCSYLRQNCNGYLQVPFYSGGTLPKYVASDRSEFVLRVSKEAFWRTYGQSEMSGDSFYYQQIVTKRAIFATTFLEDKGRYMTWKDYYEHLVDIPVDQGGIEPHGQSSVSSVDDLSDLDRGNDVTRQELQIMMQSANDDQKNVYRQVKREMEHNSATFISGAAGTGKSFVLRMFERHYRLQGYKVFKMAPTGVAAHNISGQTLHRFFGMTNQSSVPNFQVLDEYVKLYPKILLLIDEYSMLSTEMLDVINEALIKTTQRATIMGGVKTIFFGDIAQLLPIQKKEGTLWNTKIFNSVCRFHLTRPVRQQDEDFIQILNKVRVCQFDRSVIKFKNDHIVSKRCLPMNCLRLYTTLELVRKTNEKDYANFPGEGHRIAAIDSFSGATEGTTRAALKETKLASTLYLKIDMPVMLIQNLSVSQGWVNGTVATIQDIDDHNICLRKNGGVEDQDEVLYWIQRISRQVPGTSYVRSQFPIIPAFASTIHKSQSMTIDCVGIHLDNMLTHGQLYVAMSRVKKVSNLYFFGADIPAVKRG